MLNVLLTGKLAKKPRPGTSRNGSPYCQASVRVPLQANTEGEAESIFASVIAFGSDSEKLARLAQGDAVSITGTAKLNVWQPQDGSPPRPGLDVQATGILTAYELRKRRGSDGNQTDSKPASHTQPAGRRERDFDDAITF